MDLCPQAHVAGRLAMSSVKSKRSRAHGLSIARKDEKKERIRGLGYLSLICSGRWTGDGREGLRQMFIQWTLTSPGMNGLAMKPGGTVTAG